MGYYNFDNIFNLLKSLSKFEARLQELSKEIW